MYSRIRKMQEENEGGFTLIELLVVMIIIGILAAIAIPLFLNQRKNAVDAGIKSDLRTIANELESIYTNDQAYPAATGAGWNGGTATTPVNPVTVTTGDTVRVSTGNYFTYTLNPGDASLGAGSAYCLVGNNAKGSHAWVYVSNLGGLQASTVTTCPTTGNGWGAAN